MKSNIFLRRFAYLAGVAIFFYATYGGANFLASLRQSVPEIVFEWERCMPFAAWTIAPYWSLNLLYALGFWLCDERELPRYVTQLVIAQLIAVACFVIFPLKFSWIKPETTGLYGFLFSSLGAFDKPFNQAPSLHVILCVVVGSLYLSRSRTSGAIVAVFAAAIASYESLVLGAAVLAASLLAIRLNSAKFLILAWFALIAASVLTTRQHHFIDIPTGLAVGFYVLWRFPLAGEIWRPAIARFFDRVKWGWIYGGLAVLCWFAALFAGGAWSWLLYATLGFTIVRFGYFYFGADVFRKDADGKMAFSAKILLLPYLAVARINALLWLRGEQRTSEILPRVYLGSVLEADKFDAIFDLTAEFEVCSEGKIYQNYPLLDMVTPTVQELNLAAAGLNSLLEIARKNDKNVLTCCALGYSRSAAVLAVWMARYGGFEVGAAINLIRQKRPKVVIKDKLRAAIAQAAAI